MKPSRLKQIIKSCEEMRNLLLFGDPGAIVTTLKQLGVNERDINKVMEAVNDMRGCLEELSREMEGRNNDGFIISGQITV